MTGRAHSIQEFKDGQIKAKRKPKTTSSKIVPRTQYIESSEIQATSSAHQVKNEKTHMSLEELDVFYDKVIDKKSEIDDVRNAKNLDVLQKRILDVIHECLDTKLPEEDIDHVSIEVLTVITLIQHTSNLNQLEAELRGLQKQFDDALLSVAQAVEFNEESAFDKARGAKPRMVYREGRFKILRSSTNRREMNSKAFIEKYPFLAAEIAKIELGKAEKALEEHLGKAESAKEMAGFCTVNTTHQYEFQARPT